MAYKRLTVTIICRDCKNPFDCMKHRSNNYAKSCDSCKRDRAVINQQRYDQGRKQKGRRERLEFERKEEKRIVAEKLDAINDYHVNANRLIDLIIRDA